jgi:hypothetical protein
MRLESGTEVVAAAVAVVVGVAAAAQEKMTAMSVISIPIA